MTPIEEIKAKLSVEEVIGSYIPLKQVGTNFKAVCPFHQEKTPSFIVSAEKQIWHCFGCNEGGDIFMFVQKHEGVEFREALHILAEKAGVPLTNFAMPDNSRKQILYEINAAAQEHFQQNFELKGPAADKTRQYLKGRGMQEDTMAAWGLGLSTESWDGLVGELRKKYTVADLQLAGLIIVKEGKQFDRFRKRLMFPISDSQGRVVAFTARTLSRIAFDEDDFGGKYVNSPATPIYTKSAILYGFDKAKLEIRRLNYAIIVEGNMDTIMSHQAGVKNVIAVSGTALTLEQLTLLKRYSENIILSFDADTAGSHAVFRGITLAWDLNMNVKVIVLKDGKDPADVVAQDPELWRESIKTSIGVVDFYFEEVFRRIDLSRSDHKKQAAEKITGIIGKLQSAVEQAHYVTLLSKRLGIAETILWPLVKQTGKESVSAVSASIESPKLNRHISDYLLGFVALYSAHLPRVIDEIEPEMLGGEAQELYKKIIIHYTNDHHVDLRAFSNELNQSELRYWSELVFQAEELYVGYDPKQQEHELRLLLTRIKSEHLTSKLQTITEAIKAAEAAHDTALVEQLLHEYQGVSTKRSSYTAQ